MSDCCASSSSRNEAVIPTLQTLPSYHVRPGVTFPDWSAVTSRAVRDALLAMVGSGHVLNRWSGYDPATDLARVALLQFYVEHGRAPAIAALANRAGLGEAAVPPLLEELRRRDLVVLDGERIVGAYPFTDQDRGHQVTLDGRSLNAMCAVDALGIGAMTDRDISIASRCRHCGAPIRITTRDRGRALADVEPRTAVMWQSVRYEDACAASSLCAATAFFCSDDHLSAWRRERSADEPGFRLSIEEGLEAGRALFGPSLAGLGVTPRPSVDPESKSSAVANRSFHTNGRNGGAYDLVVIGAGSAGFSASITAADQGAHGGEGAAVEGAGAVGGQRRRLEPGGLVDQLDTGLSLLAEALGLRQLHELVEQLRRVLAHLRLLASQGRANRPRGEFFFAHAVEFALGALAAGDRGVAPRR